MLPQNSTLVNGAYTFSATLNTSGSQTITTTDTVMSTITGTSFSINVGTSSINFSLSTASNPVPYGTDLYLTMSVTRVNGVVPTGTFSYQLDGSPWTSAPLSNGAYTAHLGTGLLAGTLRKLTLWQ